MSRNLCPVTYVTFLSLFSSFNSNPRSIQVANRVRRIPSKFPFWLPSSHAEQVWENKEYEPDGVSKIFRAFYALSEDHLISDVFHLALLATS